MGTSASERNPLLMGLCSQCGIKPRYPLRDGGLSHLCGSCFSANRRQRRAIRKAQQQQEVD